MLFKDHTKAICAQRDAHSDDEAVIEADEDAESRKVATTSAAINSTRIYKICEKLGRNEKVTNMFRLSDKYRRAQDRRKKSSFM